MTEYDPDAILTNPNSHPKHIAYALANIGIRDRGEHWSKCANCGELYQLTPIWGDTTVCSDECYKEFVAYIACG